MKQVRFEFEELPYDTLSQFGLTQEMIEDLPMQTLEEISHGRHSPVLPIKVKDENGNTVTERSRFAFVRKEKGEADVIFFPVLKKLPLEKYNEEQKKLLQAGKTILADSVTADGRKTKVEDEPVTVGIDLNEKNGIRFCQGDSQKWSGQAKREWDKYTFGCYGCWVMGDDGSLDYISEEQYTEELWNEQKESAQRNIGSGIHK